MFIPARHELILAKAAEVFNLVTTARHMDAITACHIHWLTMPTGINKSIANNGVFAMTWDAFQHNHEFPAKFGSMPKDSNVLTNAEWWFVFILAWKHSGSFSSNSELKPVALKYYLNYIRNLLTNKKQVSGPEQYVFKKVCQLYYNTNHVTLDSPAFRMALNTAMALTVEGWANRFNTFSSPVGTRSVFPWESYPEIYRDIVDLHVDQRIALPDAIGIVVTQHREMMARAVQELITAKPV